MATTKESTVVILDVRKYSANLEKRNDCCLNILKYKIFEMKKDEIGFLLMGTERTCNELNKQMEGYENIVEYIPVGIPDFTTLAKFHEYRSEERTDSGDWLDAVIVAMDVLRREKESKKIAYLKIVIFHDFKTPVEDENVEAVIQGLKNMDIKLVVICTNVRYIDQSDGSTKAIFAHNEKKSPYQMKSESLVTKVIDECGGYLCNFDMAMEKITKVENVRPWMWTSVLEIGSKLKINISATIALKDESHLKFKTESNSEGSTSWKTVEYFKNGEKIEPNLEEMIKGYMLGATPIAYDESLGVTRNRTEKGMKCIAFAQHSYILPEYLCGDGVYLVLPKKGMESSEKIMHALVKAMAQTNMVMIARKVYNNGLKPKLVALIPNLDREVPCLSMFELFFADQYLYWYFPLLKSKKTEPTLEQYSAIDKLMEALDLNGTETDEARETFNKVILPLESLPNLSNEYVQEAVTSKILRGASAELCRSNKKDFSLEIPETMKEKSSKALQEVKSCFALEEIKKVGKRELIRHIGDIPSQSVAEQIQVQENVDYRPVGVVGTVTPAEDFLKLVERDVTDVTDETTRCANFERLSNQIKPIISDLIFKSMTDQNDKIAKALTAYRQEACFYNPYDYNDWIKEVKNMAVARKMFDFWEDVIVKNELGLLSAKDCDFFHDMDDKEPEEFYNVNRGTVDKANGNQAEVEESVDDLFENM